MCEKNCTCAVRTGLASETLASVSLIHDPTSGTAPGQGLGSSQNANARRGGAGLGTSAGGVILGASPGSGSGSLLSTSTLTSPDTSTSTGISEERIAAALLEPLPAQVDSTQSSGGAAASGIGAGSVMPRGQSSVYERGTRPNARSPPQVHPQRPDDDVGPISYSKFSKPPQPENAFSWFLRVSFVCGLVYLFAGAFGTFACIKIEACCSSLYCTF